MCAVGFTVEKLLLPLIDEMGKKFDVSVVCSRDEISDDLKTRGYNIKNINIDRKISIGGNLKSIFHLYKYLKQEKFNIVHVHTPVAAILGRIAAKLAGVPIIIYTAHGFYFHGNMGTIKRNLFVLVEKIGGWLSDYIFTQSYEDYETAIAKKIISKDKILTIGNGVDISRFNTSNIVIPKSLDLRREFGIADDDVVVTIIGRVVREKGYLEWVNAAKIIADKHKNIKFIAVGDTLVSDRDGIKAELDAYINENRLENTIIFAGSRSDIPEILSITDIFTLPSYREGMPRSLIEAMCMSKPAIATDIRGCREEVVEKVTGFLIPVKDPKALAEKLEDLIDSENLRREMGLAARKKAEKEFNEKVVVKRQLGVINELIKKKL